MLVTPSGIVTLVNDEQLKNADPPILVTGQPPNADGIVTEPETDVGTSVIVTLPLETV